MSNSNRFAQERIDEAAESFVARFRAGQTPSVEEFAVRYPEMADELRELLPALVLLERHAALNSTPALSPPSIAEPPRQIGDFRIVREIGRGGMGIVYEAEQQSLGRHVALKVLPAAGLLDPLQLERFRLEARAAASLHHRHIVPVFGVGEHNGLHYYAMQFIHGQSLDAVISELRRFREAGSKSALSAAQHVASALSRTNVSELGTSPGDRSFYRSVARLGLQTAEALGYAHDKGILHRDIKPSNLLIDAAADVWITDFGLAKAEGADGPTRTGEFIGTLRYMAPERLEGWCDRRSDLYSLGATLYELVTLRPFLESDSRAQLVERILREQPIAPARLDRAVPRDLETIVLKAIAKEPAERYPSAEAMANDLRRFLECRPISARRSTPAERLARWGRRNPVLAGLSSALVIVLACATGVSTFFAFQARESARVAEQRAREAIAQRTRVERLLAESDRQQATVLFHDMRGVLEQGEAERRLAVAALERQIRESAPASPRDAADAPRRLHLAWQHRNLAHLHSSLGSVADAERAFASAIRIYKSLAERSASSRDAENNLSETRKELSIFLWHHGRVAEAIEQWQLAMDFVERIVEEHPDDAPYESSLAHNLETLSAMELDRGDSERAVAQMRRALAISSRVARANPLISAYQFRMFENWFHLAGLEALAGQQEKALLTYQQASAAWSAARLDNLLVLEPVGRQNLAAIHRETARRLALFAGAWPWAAHSLGQATRLATPLPPAK